MRALARLFGVLLAAGLLPSCGGEPAPVALPGMSEVALDSASAEGVSGLIRTEDFSAVDVRYRIIEGEERDRLDFFFSDRRLERCGLPIERDGTLVWLRVPGVTSVAEATFATDADEHPMSVHYEVPVENTYNRGYEVIGRGSGRIELTSLEDVKLEGRVAVCFADADSSCVRGRFEAYPCYSRVDGRAVREAPGLADDALEPPEPEGGARP